MGIEHVRTSGNKHYTNFSMGIGETRRNNSYLLAIFE